MTTEVNVLLNKKRYFYNRYSEEIVSDELINYIYHESIGSNFKNKVKINIKCNFEVTEEEKEKMEITKRHHPNCTWLSSGTTKPCLKRR